eukprot:UC1_evm4s912
MLRRSIIASLFIGLFVGAALHRLLNNIQVGTYVGMQESACGCDWTTRVSLSSPFIAETRVSLSSPFIAEAVCAAVDPHCGRYYDSSLYQKPKLAVGADMLALTVHMGYQKMRPCGGQCAVYTVEENYVVTPDAIRLPREPLDDVNSNNSDVERGWRQNMDVLRVLGHFKNAECYGERLFVFNEGDFDWCPGAAAELASLKTRLLAPESWGKWSLFRTSYGMNGWVLKCEEIPTLRNILLKRIGDQGLDWFIPHALPPESLHVYRWNLFQHKFTGSRFVDNHAEALTRQRHAARCYDILVESGMPYSAGTHFDTIHCLGYDATPCNVSGGALAHPIPPEVRALVHSGAPDGLEYDALNTGRVPGVGPWPESKLEILQRRHERYQAISRQFPSAKYAIGRKNEKCDDTCLRMDMRCDDHALQLVNDCAVIADAFSDHCDNCAMWTFTIMANKKFALELLPYATVSSSGTRSCFGAFDPSTLHCGGNVGVPKVDPRASFFPLCACIP